MGVLPSSILDINCYHIESLDADYISENRKSWSKYRYFKELEDLLIEMKSLGYIDRYTAGETTTFDVNREGKLCIFQNIEEDVGIKGFITNDGSFVGSAAISTKNARSEFERLKRLFHANSADIILGSRQIYLRTKNTKPVVGRITDDA